MPIIKLECQRCGMTTQHTQQMDEYSVLYRHCIQCAYVTYLDKHGKPIEHVNASSETNKREGGHDFMRLR